MVRKELRMERKVTIILAHPEPESFCASLAVEVKSAAVEAGFEGEILDLYKEGFDPLLTGEEIRRRFSFEKQVQEHQKRVEEADMLVWIHPDWWGGMPAVLKGWLDRVFAPGFAFSFEEQDDRRIIRIPLLKGKAALTLITTDAGVAESVPAVDIWQRRVFTYTGLNPAEVLLFPDARDSDYTVRKEFIRISRETLANILQSGE